MIVIIIIIHLNLSKINIFNKIFILINKLMKILLNIFYKFFNKRIYKKII